MTRPPGRQVLVIQLDDVMSDQAAPPATLDVRVTSTTELEMGKNQGRKWLRKN